MIDKISEGILNLNIFVSHSEVDSYLRNQALMILAQAKQSTPEVQICQEYITLMEDTHDKLVQKIRLFFETFSSHFADLQTNFQTVQQDLEETHRIHSEQKAENQNIVDEMSKRIEQLNKQIFSKEEEVRQLNSKLEQKDTQIDTQQRESNDYLKKMEADFYRHQRALQDSYEIITRLEEQLQNLKNQNEHLIGLNSLLQKSRIKGNFSQALVEADREATDGQSETNISQDSPSMARSSLVNCSQQQGLSQFQQLVLADSRELLGSVDGFEMPGTETFKEMLNLSVQRFLEKQNYCINDFHLSKTKEQLWMINNSIDFAQKTVQEFHVIHQQEKTFNPYYNYFLITSQNAKINSNHFEKVCHISTEGQWKELNDLHLPLHQWQKHLKEYLLNEAKIIQ